MSEHFHWKALMLAAALSRRRRSSGFRGRIQGNGGRRRSSRSGRLLAWLMLVALGVSSAWAAALEEVEGKFRAGEYDECARLAGEEVAKGAWSDVWVRCKIESELARGKYPEALKSLEGALRRFSASLPLRLLGRQVYRFNGRDEEAAAEMETIERLVLGAPHRYATAEGRLSLGRYLLLCGADARKVLDQFYDPVTKQQPDEEDGFYAT